MSNQLFVSYRRDANDPRTLWVDEFCDGLRRNLREMVGNDVSLLRDSEIIEIGEDWRARLQAAVNEATIFLALISGSYFDSPVCREELDWFLGRMKGDPSVPRRIVPVFKQPALLYPPPVDVSTLQRHEFFTWTSSAKRNWKEYLPAEDEFWNSLARLAQDITLALEHIDGSIRRDKVFVARVCPELEPQRERLRADLQLRGCEVVPRHEYLWNAADIEAQMAADLADALLCVHLVSAGKSSDAHSVEHSLRQLLAAHALTRASGSPAPLVWIAPAAQADDMAAALIEFIQGELANAGVEYWRGNLEDLKTQIHDKLAAAGPQAPAEPPGAVALLCEEGDIAALAPLRALLADGLGIDAKLVKLQGAAPKERDRLVRALAASPRCMIFWGAQSDDWLADVLDLPELAAHLGRERLCVAFGGASSAEKLSFRSARASVIDAAADSALATLRGFFQLGAGH